MPTPRTIGALLAVLTLTLLSGACAAGSWATHPQTVDPHTLIDVRGAIGGIHAGETRGQAERVLGRGTTISTTIRHPKSGGYTLARVAYPGSGLVVVYSEPAHRRPIVFGIFTSSRRYHTASGLRVGSTLGHARRTPGVRCVHQVGEIDCQGGLGYERPVTGFTVRHGRVVDVFMAAVAD